MIPHSAPLVDASVIRAVMQRLDEGWLGPGPATDALTEAIADSTGACSAWSTASGTEALYLACLSLGLAPGSHVAVPEWTCTDVPVAVRRAGLIPVLSPVDPERLTLDVSRVAASCEAVIAVHAWGAAVDADALDRTGLPWIEDCATSPMITHADGRAAGSRGAASIFSFGPTKYLAAGSGGMVCLHSDTASDALRAALDERCERPRRQSDLHAAIALELWSRKERLHARRVAIADAYDDALRDSPHRPRARAVGDCDFRYLVHTEGPAASVATTLQAHGIDARISVNPWLARDAAMLCVGMADASLARAHWEHNTLSVPIYPAMTDDDTSQIIDVLLRSLRPDAPDAL